MNIAVLFTFAVRHEGWQAWLGRNYIAAATARCRLRSKKLQKTESDGTGSQYRMMITLKATRNATLWIELGLQTYIRKTLAFVRI